MKYARPPFPPALWQKFCRIAVLTGHVVRGQKWHMLDRALDYIELHPDLFCKRP